MSRGFDFSGRQVWVSGAGSGIGYRTACRFQQAGAQVVGFDIAFPAGEVPFSVRELDVSDPQAVADCCRETLAGCPELDVLVIGAGILRLGATESLPFADWQRCLAVNAGGAFNLFQAVIPQFRRQRRGAIVTVASNAAHVPRSGMSAYCASKAALRSLSLSVGLELAPFGVRCNLISPGSTDTPMLRSMWRSPAARRQVIDGAPAQFRLGIPLGKLATVDDIADAILFMASDMASHITLQDVVIDGGATLGA
ncbi:2,3-dihydro-2,3-dihydroxybenzoate dehydrogenase [Affinibrenneria salicis]|uniref:2,3-dihydro-2,3-dihydroxybenzoate dehydrogenase n=1 Tax=Affinibrenneria salicis TaxID=2590031 RepID=A0A5J5G3R8_9GAMM|nr:2,3-dihydro-2,3-dihydroxybenzoate dehydrogenase [Affinibrenneria salicis]KAA9001301.1 2,3-dihydro-2,3-dihydroxybenzoate dehydrogenase [Affinibrenneria salicis]